MDKISLSSGFNLMNQMEENVAEIYLKSWYIVQLKVASEKVSIIKS